MNKTNISHQTRRRQQGIGTGEPLGLRLAPEMIADFKSTAAKLGISGSLLFSQMWQDYQAKNAPKRAKS